MTQTRTANLRLLFKLNLIKKVELNQVLLNQKLKQKRFLSATGLSQSKPFHLTRSFVYDNALKAYRALSEDRTRQIYNRFCC